MKPMVAIVGRPNVGKSTFFNLLAGRNRAIVEDRPGVTRDLNYMDATWRGRPFWLVDSGGYEEGVEDVIAVEIRRQIEFAMEEADIIVFLVDGSTGPVPMDQEMADLLRRRDKLVVPVANKVDNERIDSELTEFFALGLGEFQAVSSKNRRGFKDLMDHIVSLMPEQEQDDDRASEDKPCRFAIVGRPNVGKSSLVNALIGRERVVVSEVPGTTRDAINIPFQYKDRQYELVDTAGIRRKAKVTYKVETYSVVRALRTLDRCDIALIVLDADRSIAAQDERIAGYAHERGCGCILVVNKWDLAKKGVETIREFEKEVKYRFPFLSYVSILFVSALKGKGMEKIMDAVARVRANQLRRIGTGQLNEWLEQALLEHSPPIHLGRRVKIYYMTQVGVAPPSFVGFVNFPKAVHFSYQRYLSNGLRKLEDFAGTPIRLKFKKRTDNSVRKKPKRREYKNKK